MDAICLPRVSLAGLAWEEGKLAMAKNFLSMGMDAETIAKAAELPVAKIVELQKLLLN
ncbi:MAG: hypothetical protein PVH64_13030 [Bacillota bacterium]